MSLLKKCAILTALNSFALIAAFPQATPPPSSVSPSPAPVAADQASPAAAPPAPAAAPTWSIGPLDISGTVDGYYSFNGNHPNSPTNFNGLYNFNDRADSFDLSLAKLTLNHDPDPVGVHVDFGFGRTMDFLHPSDSTGVKYLEQAFVSLKPPKAKGMELDFGEFVTSAGAEVIEAKDNWNYSRSLLFAWAIPYYHFGLRSTMPITKSFTGGIQVVNGWNNIEDNNSGKTIGLTGAYVKPKFSYFANYYVGPENSSTNKGFRNLIDTTLLLTPPGKLNAYINYDYGQNRNAAILTTSYVTTSLARWQGIAVAAHYQATPKVAITPRFEYFKDYQGFETGTAQDLKEFTLTAEYKLVEGVLFRGEYRGDFSDASYFVKGSGNSDKNQHTLTFAVVGFFGPKR